ncbi:unnamed protein product [Phytomonas sp. Hart1]|nr:unnamed protein product [Phytomonas sp. Hart1]|eukprot:CCW71732.1 unnamed protein product [Phytomonas sp. isolate Hart1]
MAKNTFKWQTFPELISVSGQAKVHEPISNSVSTTQHDVWGYVEYPDGTLYEGWCLRGNPNGHGIFYYASGDIFVGQISKGNVNGDGTVFFQSGDFFFGEFRDGRIYKGLYGRNNCEVSGVWEVDRCIEAQFVALPEGLQQKHGSLFSVMLCHVHQHFSNYRIYVSQLRGTIKPDLNLRPPQKILPIPHASDSRFGWSSASPVLSTSLSHVNAHHECSKNTLDSGALRNMVLNTPGGLFAKGLVIRKAGEHDTMSKCEDSRDTRILCAMQSLPYNVIFSCSAPACNEYFSSRRYQLRCFVFLFPFLSFPWSPVAPLRVSTVDQEREFVVSGATLRQDFDSMNLAINSIAVAVCCQILSILIVIFKTNIGHVSMGCITIVEMIVPCVLWLVLAMFCAGYNSYFRYPHFLERMDRQLTPKLSAFAASMVDARANVCISTWDEEGRGKVMNRHYLYRWVFFSLLSGIIFSLAAPITRVVYGHSLFKSGFAMCALLLSSFATFLFTTTLMYYVFKITDIQREIAAKLRVLSDLAYIEKRGIIRPSIYIRQTFDMGAPLDTSDLLNGFTGWYTTRSLILYCSSYSNHLSRSAAMSIFATVIFILGVMGIINAFSVYFLYPRNHPNHNIIAHSYGLLVFVIWGIQLIRYINASACTQRELSHHQYIMNLTSMYHRTKHRDVEASAIIKHCGEMATSHDFEPQWYNFPMYPITMFLLVLLNITAFSASVFLLSREIFK